MSNGALSLFDYPTEKVIIECRRCEKRGGSTRLHSSNASDPTKLFRRYACALPPVSDAMWQKPRWREGSRLRSAVRTIQSLSSATKGYAG